MRENRPSGLMRGGKQPVIGPRAFQPAASRLFYTLLSPFKVLEWKLPFAKCFVGGEINVSENFFDRHLHAV